MAYQSAYTGSEIDGAIGTVKQKESSWDSKQNKLTGVQGQVVGFDDEGDAVAMPAPDTGVTTFNGRTGDVTPQSEDYTADMVGARPNTWTPSASEVGAAPASHVEVVGSSSGIGHVKSGGSVTINEDGTMTLTSVDGGTF